MKNGNFLAYLYVHHLFVWQELEGKDSGQGQRVITEIVVFEIDVSKAVLVISVQQTEDVM